MFQSHRQGGEAAEDNEAEVEILSFLCLCPEPVCEFAAISKELVVFCSHFLFRLIILHT